METLNPYQSPPQPSPDSPETPSNWVDYAPSFNDAIKTALKIQMPLAILTALTLDSGQLSRMFWVAMLCQWATVFMLLWKRPTTPTKMDLFVVRYGIIPILVIIAEAGPAFLSYVGLV